MVLVYDYGFRFFDRLTPVQSNGTRLAVDHDRHLGNRNAYCLVNGEKAYYVGNICMDVAMIDVTDIDCKEGDRVIIFGDELPVTTLSTILGTIPYEILTSISDRVKRIYYQD